MWVIVTGQVLVGAEDGRWGDRLWASSPVIHFIFSVK